MDPYESYIPKGKENAVHQSDLAIKWQCTQREVRKIIEELRLSGVHVVTDQNGYYQTNDPDEIDAFVRKQRAKAYSMLRSVQAMRRYVIDTKKGKQHEQN